MRKILLTSAGFENEIIKNKFLELINKKSTEIKALFITTAAVEPDAIMVLPECLNDLLKCGIPKENITVYDMHKLISLNEYDVIYVCGGDTSYLVNRINEIGFKSIVKQYIDKGGIYIGVSAGSVAASKNYPNGLNFIKNELAVHCDEGTNLGIIDNDEQIFLTNNQAILITSENMKIIGN